MDLRAAEPDGIHVRTCGAPGPRASCEIDRLARERPDAEAPSTSSSENWAPLSSLRPNTTGSKFTNREASQGSTPAVSSAARMASSSPVAVGKERGDPDLDCGIEHGTHHSPSRWP